MLLLIINSRDLRLLHIVNEATCGSDSLGGSLFAHTLVGCEISGRSVRYLVQAEVLQYPNRRRPSVI